MIFIQNDSGICQGLKETLNIIYETYENNPDKKIYIYNNFINNQKVINELNDLDIEFTNDLSIVTKEDILIINTYGISQSELTYLKSNGIKYIDTTCKSLKTFKKELLANYNKDKLKYKDDFKLDLYLQMILNIMFGMSSNFREYIREQKIATSFYTGIERADNFRILEFMAESTDPKKFIDILNNYLNNISIKEEDLERLKKVWIANEVKMIDVIDNTVYNQYDDIIKYQDIIPNKVDIIRSLNKKEIDKIISNIKVNNTATVVMLPNK